MILYTYLSFLFHQTTEIGGDKLNGEYTKTLLNNALYMKSTANILPLYTKTKPHKHLLLKPIQPTKDSLSMN